MRIIIPLCALALCPKVCGLRPHPLSSRGQYRDAAQWNRWTSSSCGTSSLDLGTHRGSQCRKRGSFRKRLTRSGGMTMQMDGEDANKVKMRLRYDIFPGCIMLHFLQADRNFSDESTIRLRSGQNKHPRAWLPEHPLLMRTINPTTRFLGIARSCSCVDCELGPSSKCRMWWLDRHSVGPPPARCYPKHESSIRELDRCGDNGPVNRVAASGAALVSPARPLVRSAVSGGTSGVQAP